MMQKEFTGRKMAAILVAGFGVVVAVNFTMAAIASGSFSGVVVENSYVASQKFNDWLDQAERQQALGWNAEASRSGDRLALDLENVPASARITAQVRRPLGQADPRELTFVQTGEARLLSSEALPAGRWIVRVSIERGDDRWVSEEQIG